MIIRFTVLTSIPGVPKRNDEKRRLKVINYNKVYFSCAKVTSDSHY